MNKPIILVMNININLPQAQSIKEKRNLRRRIRDRFRQRYNVSIAEVSSLEMMRTLELCLAYVAITESKAKQMLTKFTDDLELVCENHQAYLTIEYDLF